jgi:[protein-PII] uridylyltransferase
LVLSAAGTSTGKYFMPTQSPLSSELRERYEAESARLQRDFSTNNDGLKYLQERSALVDSMARRFWEQLAAASGVEPSHIVFAAVGDLGRQTLFPYSEIDFVFLAATGEAAQKFKDAIQRLTQGMSEIGLKANSTTRIISEFAQLESENTEAILSLLDCRFLGGDEELFASLRSRLIPDVMVRESHALVERLAELTRNTQRKYANTVFHLEPNVKDGPGGFQDYVTSRWLAAMSVMEKHAGWPDPHTYFSPANQAAMDSALRFFASVRCFLHFRNKRDHNHLTWDAQDEAAAKKIGTQNTDVMSATDWMRVYFGHARAVEHISGQLLEEMPAAQSLFYRQLETWRTGFSDEDFSVVDGLIFFQKPENLSDAGLFFRVFRLIAQRGFKLSPTAEHQLEDARLQLSANPPSGGEFWRFLEDILPELHAADALRAMHSLHLLTLFLPELKGIEALAVRDVSHRFTVDEHTLQAIDKLHGLRQSKSKWDERYAGILGELDQPELLNLAILLHDTGKAVTLLEPIPASLEIAAKCLERLELPEADRATVLFLIQHHQDLGAGLRRDIFDPRTVAQFAESIGSPELLKMLCLFTYADIKAVNPEALTPWKAEDLWQLYIGTANYFNRSVDERVHGDANDEVLNHLRSLAAAAGQKLQTFLEGLPRRYLRTHPVDEILRHFEMSGRLGQDPVQLAVKRTRHWYELTVVTKDRPRLFSTVAGTLAACGMNIGKAGAFSNAGGTVVDTFSFTDRYRTLEMNLPAWERFKTTVHEVLSGKRDLKRMLRERLEAENDQPGKFEGTLQIQFDNECSAHSTLIEIITQDQPGLLYRISSVFAQQECNIDIALIDTEGQTAIDVFYLTTAGGKLTSAHQDRLRQSLIKEFSV